MVSILKGYRIKVNDKSEVKGENVDEQNRQNRYKRKIMRLNVNSWGNPKNEIIDNYKRQEIKLSLEANAPIDIQDI